MRSKTDFYRLFFEQLARKGFDVKRSQSSDYIADIYYKNQLVAYFSKADTVIQNPFVAVKDKVMRLINDTAQNTAVKVGICRDCPYTDANEKLPNGSYKLAEYNGVTLACKEHHLFGYVFSTYRTAPDSGEMLARQVFLQQRVCRSGLCQAQRPGGRKGTVQRGRTKGSSRRTCQNEHTRSGCFQ